MENTQRSRRNFPCNKPTWISSKSELQHPFHHWFFPPAALFVERCLESPSQGSQFHGDAGTASSPSGSSTTPHFLWLCTKAGTGSVPSLTAARVSGLCFNEKTRARTARRYGALMRREHRWKASRSIFSASGWSIWKQQSIKLDLYI